MLYGARIHVWLLYTPTITYLQSREVVMPRAYNQVHAVCYSKGVSPVVIWNTTVVLAYRKHKAVQLINIKPTKK